MVKLFKDAPGIFYDDVGFGENVNQGFCLAYKFSFMLWDFLERYCAIPMTSQIKCKVP